MAEWSRVTTSIMILVLCLNAAFILVDTTGIAGMIGVSTGLDQNVFAQFATNAQNLETTPNNMQWAEVATIKLASSLSTFFNLGFALPFVLISIGIPEIYVTFLSAPIYACFVLSMIYYITGRST
jgi:hypothetical protein|tara:strand:+ start:269 stop:643 length:375 start_codon:yes stop_codon:yes gene_type:complete